MSKVVRFILKNLNLNCGCGIAKSDMVRLSNISVKELRQKVQTRSFRYLGDTDDILCYIDTAIEHFKE